MDTGIFSSQMSTIIEIIGNQTIPKVIITSIVGWGGAYLLIKKTTKQEPEWAVRVVTIVHAILISLLAFLDWFYIRPWNIKQLGETNSKYEEVVLCLTLGYFIFDIVWILKYQTEGAAMYFHHGASILCLSGILHKGNSAPEVLVGISGLESSNPCLQTRWFLRTYGYQGTWMYTVTEIAFITTFIAFRIFYGTYLTYNIILHPNCNYILKMGAICLYAVSCAFAYQMFSYLSKRYIKSWLNKAR